MNGQSFWTLYPYPGFHINAHIKSVQTLSLTVAYGAFNPELFLLLTQVKNREVARDTILAVYFAAQRTAYYQHKELNDGFYQEIQALILNDPEVKYKHLSLVMEEDIFVRSGLFKRYIPQLYKDSCAMTGMRMRSKFKYNFIDACHIIPFAVTPDDKVSNGIALCPNLHRAFDRGLVSIDEHYRVIISSHLDEDSSHPYSLKSLEGRLILLPDESQHYPSQTNLEWHRNKVFKQ